MRKSFVFRFMQHESKRSIDFIIYLFEVWFARGRRQPQWITKDELNKFKIKMGSCFGRMAQNRQDARKSCVLFILFDVAIFHEIGAHISRDAYLFRTLFAAINDQPDDAIFHCTKTVII